MARNGAATRKSIMDAAQALILETGFSATSVDTVIARAGITKGAFFYHFRTKADLAEALVERDAAEDLHLLEEHLTQAERSEERRVGKECRSREAADGLNQM